MLQYTRAIIEMTKAILKNVIGNVKVNNTIHLYDGIEYQNTYSPCYYTDNRIRGINNMYLSCEITVGSNGYITCVPKVISIDEYNPFLELGYYPRLLYDISHNHTYYMMSVINNSILFDLNDIIGENNNIAFVNVMDVIDDITNTIMNNNNISDIVKIIKNPRGAYKSLEKIIIDRIINSNENNIDNEICACIDFDNLLFKSLRQKGCVDNIESIIYCLCEGYKNDIDNMYIFIGDVVKCELIDCVIDNCYDYDRIRECIINAKNRMSRNTIGITFVFGIVTNNKAKNMNVAIEQVQKTQKIQKAQKIHKSQKNANNND